MSLLTRTSLPEVVAQANDAHALVFAKRQQSMIPCDNHSSGTGLETTSWSCSSITRRNAASPRPPGKTTAETRMLVSKTTFTRRGGARGPSDVTGLHVAFFGDFRAFRFFRAPRVLPPFFPTPIATVTRRSNRSGAPLEVRGEVP